MRAVVLGIGNIILSDEGLGVRVVEALQESYRLPEGVCAVDGGTSGMELLEELSNLDFLIVVDVIKAGKAPGTVIKLAGDEVPVFFRKKLSPHQIGLSDVLASLELLGSVPKEMIVLGVQPVSFELGMEITPTVAEKIPELVDRVTAELAARGCVLKPVFA